MDTFWYMSTCDTEISDFMPTPVCPSTCFAGDTGPLSHYDHRCKLGKGPSVTVEYSPLGGLGYQLMQLTCALWFCPGFISRVPSLSHDASCPSTDTSNLTCPPVHMAPALGVFAPQSGSAVALSDSSFRSVLAPFCATHVQATAIFLECVAFRIK